MHQVMKDVLKIRKKESQIMQISSQTFVLIQNKGMFIYSKPPFCIQIF